MVDYEDNVTARDIVPRENLGKELYCFQAQGNVSKCFWGSSPINRILLELPPNLYLWVAICGTLPSHSAAASRPGSKTKAARKKPPRSRDYYGTPT